MKDYNFDSIYELVQKSLNDLNRCTDIVTRTEYIEIFNKLKIILDFNIESIYLIYICFYCKKFYYLWILSYIIVGDDIITLFKNINRF
jgi:hypothetical protein